MRYDLCTTEAIRSVIVRVLRDEQDSLVEQHLHRAVGDSSYVLQPTALSIEQFLLCKKLTEILKFLFLCFAAEKTDSQIVEGKRKPFFSMNGHQHIPEVPLWISGRAVTSDGTDRIDVWSAAQGKVVTSAQNANVKQAVLAAESAWTAFQHWKNSTPASRRDIINRMKDLLIERKDEVVAAQMEETSCARSWAEFNIQYVTTTLAEIAARVTVACAGELPAMSTQGPMGFVFKESIGPVLLMAP